MKQTFFVLALLFGSALHAGIVDEVVVPPKEHIAQRRKILPWIHVWQDKDAVALKLSLHEAYSTPGNSPAIHCVPQKESLSAQTIRNTYSNLKLIERSETREAAHRESPHWAIPSVVKIPKRPAP